VKCEALVMVLLRNGEEKFMSERQIVRAAHLPNTNTKEVRISLKELNDYLRVHQLDQEQAILKVHINVECGEEVHQEHMQPPGGQIQHEHHLLRPTNGTMPLHDPPPLDEQITTRLRERTSDFIGLENQGATCYLNSLLQTLFHLRMFRKIICEIPLMPADDGEQQEGNQQQNASSDLSSTATHDTSISHNPQNNCVVALQTLFYNMMRTPTNSNSQVPTRTRTCTTEDLTKSFGWDEEDVFEQHDVQELFSILLEKLETQLKRASMPNFIAQLFEGKEQRYIKCLNVPYQSKNDQTYRDIQLTVENCKNIYESFQRYTETELMTGSNQYQTDEYGLQDAKMGSIFLSFPPVLVLHLKRFAFDHMTGFMKKVDDRFEFDEEIDLRAYLDQTDEMSDKDDIDTEYVLFSIMVQAGSLEMGHYYNYIRPMTELGMHGSATTLLENSPWYEFNDEKVTRVDKHFAIENNFGGDNKHSSAYMLVYIRKSALPSILVPLGREIFSDHVLSIVQKQQEMHERKLFELKQLRQRAYFQLYHDSIIEKRAHMIGSFSDLIPPTPERNGDGTKSGIELNDKQKEFFRGNVARCTKGTTYGELLDLVHRNLGMSKSKEKTLVRLWLFEQRQNDTSRPMTLLSTNSLDAPLQTLPALRGQCSKGALEERLFVEVFPREDGEDAVSVTHVDESHAILFFKLIEQNTLTYYTCYTLPRDTKLKEVWDIMTQQIRTENILWNQCFLEEMDASTIEEKDNSLSIEDNGLGSGDILVLVPANYSPEKINDLYASIANRVHITLVPFQENANGIPLVARKDLLYTDFCVLVGQHLQWPSNQLRFYGYDDFQEEYTSIPFKMDEIRCVQDMLNSQEGDYYLAFEKLDESVENRESKKEFTLHFYDGIQMREDLPIVCLADSTLEMILLESQKVHDLGIPIDDLQVVAVKCSRIEQIYSLDTTIQELDDQRMFDPKITLRLEEVIQEKDSEEGWYQIEVTHYIKALSRLLYTDVPFLMNVNLLWDTQTLRKNINQRLSIKTLKRTEASRLALMQKDESRIYLGNSDVLGDKITEDTTHIGLERTVNSSSKKLSIS